MWVSCLSFLPGINVDAVDKGINGCVVKFVSPLGAVSKDGRIAVSDYILTVNNESMRRITNAQARAILRRASLLGTDIRCARNSPAHPHTRHI